MEVKKSMFIQKKILLFLTLKNPISGAVDVCFLSSLPIKDWMKILKKKEIEVEIGPVHREGATGKLNSIYLRDPDMNLIEISNKI